jgi:hypothetical protein
MPMASQIFAERRTARRAYTFGTTTPPITKKTGWIALPEKVGMPRSSR